jgi:hypothetical protein
MTTNEPLVGGRLPGQVYLVGPLDEGRGWEVGWDPDIGAYFAQRVELDEDGTVVDLDSKLVELSALERLSDHMSRPIPADVAEDLIRDAMAFPHGQEISDTPLADWAASIYHQLGIGPRWTLPAAQVAEVLEAHRAEWGNRSTTDVARGLGIDTQLANDIVDGTRPELTIDEISELCTGLRCSPFDMWDTNLARSILHAYGPEQWPAYIEPIGERSTALSPNSRSEASTPIEALQELASSDRQETEYVVTGYTYVPPTSAKEFASERQRPFRQATEPWILRLGPLLTDEPTAGPVNPRMARIARVMAEDPFGPTVDLVQFTARTDGTQYCLVARGDTETWEPYNGAPTAPPGDATRHLEQRHLTETTQSGSIQDFDPSDLIVTLYQRTNIFVIDNRGRRDALNDDTVSADADREYHYSFKQIARPAFWPLGLLADERLAGDGVDPRLAALASDARYDLTAMFGDKARADMVRFTPPTGGDETWLGWHPESSTWELWDDPRRHYTGDPTHVLDPGEQPNPEHWTLERETRALDRYDETGQLYADDPEPPEPADHLGLDL